MMHMLNKTEEKIRDLFYLEEADRSLRKIGSYGQFAVTAVYPDKGEGRAVTELMERKRVSCSSGRKVREWRKTG